MTIGAPLDLFEHTGKTPASPSAAAAIDPDRAGLRATLDAAVARLVARAAADGWPIRADHCFLRIAYDTACAAKWDTVHARPACATLPLDRLTSAVAVLDRIEAEGRPALDALNAASLAFRRAVR